MQVACALTNAVTTRHRTMTTGLSADAPACRLIGRDGCASGAARTCMVQKTGTTARSQSHRH